MRPPTCGGSERASNHSASIAASWPAAAWSWPTTRRATSRHGGGLHPAPHRFRASATPGDAAHSERMVDSGRLSAVARGPRETDLVSEDLTPQSRSQAHRGGFRPVTAWPRLRCEAPSGVGAAPGPLVPPVSAASRRRIGPRRALNSPHRSWPLPPSKRPRIRVRLAVPDPLRMGFTGALSNHDLRESLAGWQGG